jgi:hypothetical protein
MASWSTSGFRLWLPFVVHLIELVLDQRRDEGRGGG